MDIEKDLSPSNRQTVRLRAVVELLHAIGYLDDLANSLKDGSVRVAQGADKILLRPASLVELELEVYRKGLKEGISINLGWRAEPTIEDSSPLALKITSGATED